MTVALHPLPRSRASAGGAPARRAVNRWAWRLYRREWRQQALIVVLLIVAVAATIIGLGVASNATHLSADPTFGTANTIVTLPGSDPQLSADLAALQQQFGPIDVIDHQTVQVPGAVLTIDVRAQNPNGPYGRVLLRLDSGRYPTGPGQVAVTSAVAQDFGLRVGSVWTEGGRSWRVVGTVENPLNLLDQFALVAPGQLNPPGQVSVLLNSSSSAFQGFRLPSGQGLNVGQRGAGSPSSAEAVILVLGSLGLLFVGLMGVAGFTVMAHRRLRAIGMLGALGATDRHVRRVMVANGAAVGASAALVGGVVGLVAWMAFVPTLQSLSEHRIDRFDLPWWAIGAALVLTFITAVAAAWWPARALVRIPIVAALSGRPPRPQPARRFAALGGSLLGAGLVLLAFADQHRVGFIIGGTVATAVGLLFLAPLAIRVLARAGRHWTVSARLALRDLVRYQARSGAALGAVTLAIGIAATIAISAAGAENPHTAGNLPANELMLYLAPAGGGNPVPPLTPAQQQAATTVADQLGATIHASAALPLEQAYDPHGSLQTPLPGGSQQSGYGTATLADVTQTNHGISISTMITLYVATPTVLSHYGISASQLNPAADVISSRSDLSGLQVFDPDLRPGPGTGPGPIRDNGITHPVIQTVAGLPAYTSAPGTLITSHAMQTLGLQALPAAWLIQTPHSLTTAQIQTARKAAATSGLYVETRTSPTSLAPLRNWSTAAGIALALGVLAMTVGLIRSETGNDLRTLTATGASSHTRRTLTGATAGALALLGALLGTAGAYAALLLWHRSNLHPLSHVPVLNLVVILAGLPLLALAGGWLLAGREPPEMARRPLE
ncbi:MAG: FtsX-like permease family protein [Acidimicrobiales bacterium]